MKGKSKTSSTQGEMGNTPNNEKKGPSTDRMGLGAELLARAAAVALTVSHQGAHLDAAVPQGISSRLEEGCSNYIQ